MTQQKYLKSLQIIFIAIVLGSVSYLAAVVFIKIDDQDTVTNYNDPLLYIVIAMTTIAIISSYLIYKFRLPGIKGKESVSEKLNAWRTLFIIRIALMEAACLFSVVGLFLTGFDIFLYMAVALIAFQFINIPTREKIKNDLELSEEEVGNL